MGGGDLSSSPLLALELLDLSRQTTESVRLFRNGSYFAFGFDVPEK